MTQPSRTGDNMWVLQGRADSDGGHRQVLRQIQLARE